MADKPTEKTKTVLVFYLNGERMEEPDPDPRSSLLQYLRRQRHLTGTKDACGEGGCGACTVMISKYDRQDDKVRHLAVNACIRPLCSLHGWAVTTIEGIGGSASTRLHPIQEQLIQHHGTQCGFCTPGFVMSMYTLLRNNPKPTEEDIRECIRGNLCRCTGYRSIYEGFRSFATDQECPMGDQCCKKALEPDEGPTPDAPPSKMAAVVLDPTQEPIFPPELQVKDYDKDRLHFEHVNCSWMRPVSLSELLELIKTHKKTFMVAGSTSFKWKIVEKGSVLVDINGVPDMHETIVGTDEVTIGAALTVGQFEKGLQEVMERTEENTPASLRGMINMAQMLRQFAATQIKNVVTFGGIISTSYGDSDALPLLLARGCSFELASIRGRRTITLEDHLFNNRNADFILKDEVIVSLTLPYIRNNEYVHFFKQARRKDLDAALVNAALKVRFEDSSAVVQDIHLYLGGLGVKTFTARSVHLLKGKMWTENQMKIVLDALKSEVEEVFPEQSYQTGLACSLFFKFVMAVVDDLRDGHILGDLPEYPKEWKDSLNTGQESHYRSTQICEDKEGEHKVDTVGKPVMHLSSKQQATGESQYVDDIPVSQDELHVGLVLSTKPHAKLLNVDPSKCLSLPGVVDFITYKDVPGSNEFALITIKDEQVFAKDEVTCVGQVIGAVLAKSPEEAQLAAGQVRVEYEVLPYVTDLRQAVEQKSLLFDAMTYKRGDVVDGFARSDCILEGEVQLGGQEHFYMETHRSLCTPIDGNQEMDVFISSSWLSGVQNVISTVLGIPAHRVRCHTKRVGGNFGGKELRSWITSTIAAVGAYKHNKPVRCLLSRNVDMQVTGGRHPALTKYKVGATKLGKIHALELEVYIDGGHTSDVSGVVPGQFGSALDNCYFVPAVSVHVAVCKTNLPSNTACRGFGRVQAMLICEHWLSHVAEALEMDQDVIREANFLKEGDEMCFNMTAEDVTLQMSWDDVKRQSLYDISKSKIRQFNAENRLKKRGISLQPAKYGFPFPVSVLNQTGALVQIYKDGTVLLTHGGVEVGQGLHTKMIQIAARVLEVPVDAIFISDTSTDKVPNMSATAGSTGSDLNGMAVLNACETLKARLQPYKESNPDGNMSNWATAAYFNRVSLSATGFYAEPHSDLGFDWKSGKGKPCTYFSYSAGCSEVEIDVLTGECTLLRTDIVMDVGQSLNPAIDIGQIEGAFIMGCGLYLLEELRYDDEGKLLTCDTKSYKIPSISTVPREFNVSILKNSHNKHAIYSSKGIGEPSILLASTVFFALKDAIRAARAEIGLTGHFRLDSPATVEKIQLACGDQLGNLLSTKAK